MGRFFSNCVKTTDSFACDNLIQVFRCVGLFGQHVPHENDVQTIASNYVIQHTQYMSIGCKLFGNLLEQLMKILTLSRHLLLCHEIYYSETRIIMPATLEEDMIANVDMRHM